MAYYGQLAKVRSNPPGGMRDGVPQAKLRGKWSATKGHGSAADPLVRQTDLYGRYDPAKKEYVPYTFEELNGGAPRKDPKRVKYDERGQVVIEFGRPWKEKRTHLLVAVGGMYEGGTMVAVRAWNADLTFRRTMSVYDFRDRFVPYDLS